MNGVVRTVLIDPDSGSRGEIQRSLGAIPAVCLAEVVGSYAGAAERVAEVAPDLTLVAIDADPRRAIALIQEVLRARPDAAVLPVSRVRDSSIILGVLRAGAREFATLGASSDDLVAAIERLARPKVAARDAGASGPGVIALLGAAGGVGCTTLAVNLAACLAKDPARPVALADFDLVLGSVDACLDIDVDQSLLEVAQNVGRLDMTLLRRALARHASGVHVLPRPASLEDADRIEPEALRRVLTLMRASFETVILDIGKGFQPPDVLALEEADAILLVLQLDPICIRNAARLLEMFRRHEGMEAKIRLVANRVGSPECEINPKKAEEALKAPIAWQVPHSTRSIHAARVKGQPLSTESAGSKAHQAILEIAHALRPRPEEPAPRPRRGLFAALF